VFILKSYLSRLDPGTSLGLVEDSIANYRVGDITRMKGELRMRLNVFTYLLLTSIRYQSFKKLIKSVHIIEQYILMYTVGRQRFELMQCCWNWESGPRECHLDATEKIRTYNQFQDFQ